MNINEISAEIFEVNKSKGFWDAPEFNIGEKLMLIVSEVSEALEADRAGKHANVEMFDAYQEAGQEFDTGFLINIKDTFEDEMADVAIRLFDLCHKMNIDLEKHIALKVRYNKLRPHMHGKKY